MRRCIIIVAKAILRRLCHFRCPNSLLLPKKYIAFLVVAVLFFHCSHTQSHIPAHLTPLTQHLPIMMSKVFVFLVISIATVSLSSPAAGLPDGRNLPNGRNSPDGEMFFNFGRDGGRKTNDRTCTTNDECKGTKTRVCDIEHNHCVKCIQDSDCRTGKALLYRSLGNDKHDRVHYRDVPVQVPVPVERGQRHAGPAVATTRKHDGGQFCFLNKCKDTLPGKATCIKYSWCTSGMCENGVCAESKIFGRQKPL